MKRDRIILTKEEKESLNRGTGSVHDDFLSADVRQRKVSGGFRRFQRVSGGANADAGFRFQVSRGFRRE